MLAQRYTHAASSYTRRSRALRDARVTYQCVSVVVDGGRFHSGPLLAERLLRGQHHQEIIKRGSEFRVEIKAQGKHAARGRSIGAART